MLEHNGRFNSRRDYDKFERMELMESPVRDAIHELKTYSLETLTQRFDVRLLGRGKRVFARLDAEDNKWYYFSLAYIPRALNNRDVNIIIISNSLTKNISLIILTLFLVNVETFRINFLFKSIAFQ